MYALRNVYRWCGMWCALLRWLKCARFSVGQVYDCEHPTPDTRAMLSAPGICTYCGAFVSLSYSDGSSNDAMADVARVSLPTWQACRPLNSAGPAAAAPAPTAPSESVHALRERLAACDAAGAAPSSLIDDQSDCFEIEANAWLSPEERRTLREREALLAERHARGSAVRVTLDLRSRRVVMEEAEEGGTCSAEVEDAAGPPAGRDWRQDRGSATAPASLGEGAATRDASTVQPAGAAPPARAKMTINPLVGSKYSFDAESQAAHKLWKDAERRSGEQRPERVWEGIVQHENQG